MLWAVKYGGMKNRKLSVASLEGILLLVFSPSLLNFLIKKEKFENAILSHCGTWL